MVPFWLVSHWLMNENDFITGINTIPTRPTPRFTRAGQVWVWSRGGGYYGADVVGGCKELSAGGDSSLCLSNCRREFFIAADAWKDTRHGVGCNSLLGR
jgi:hypothetical protein